VRQAALCATGGLFGAGGSACCGQFAPAARRRDRRFSCDARAFHGSSGPFASKGQQLPTANATPPRNCSPSPGRRRSVGDGLRLRGSPQTPGCAGVRRLSCDMQEGETADATTPPGRETPPVSPAAKRPHTGRVSGNGNEERGMSQRGSGPPVDAMAGVKLRRAGTRCARDGETASAGGGRHSAASSPGCKSDGTGRPECATIRIRRQPLQGAPTRARRPAAEAGAGGERAAARGARGGRNRNTGRGSYGKRVKARRLPGGSLVEQPPCLNGLRHRTAPAL